MALPDSLWPVTKTVGFRSPEGRLLVSDADMLPPMSTKLVKLVEKKCEVSMYSASMVWPNLGSPNVCVKQEEGTRDMPIC